MLKKISTILILTAVFCLSRGSSFAKITNPADSLKTVKGFPVILKSDTLFNIYGSVGTFTAEKRAEEISSKLKELSKNDEVIYDSIKVSQYEGLITLSLDETIIMAVVGADAQAVNKSSEKTLFKLLN